MEANGYNLAGWLAESGTRSGWRTTLGSSGGESSQTQQSLRWATRACSRVSDRTTCACVRACVRALLCCAVHCCAVLARHPAANQWQSDVTAFRFKARTHASAAGATTIDRELGLATTIVLDLAGLLRAPRSPPVACGGELPPRTPTQS
jgi:hypothetical protein